MVEQTITLSSVSTIKYIYHISDVHIRLLYRHKEYTQVFERVYEEIRNKSKDSIIYIAGDLLHAKLDLSPEAIDLSTTFLKTLADICPTIIIAGNHDCNVNNFDRMDSIKPIVESLNHKQLFYLRDTGIYHINNIDFIVYSIFDSNPFNQIDFSKSTQFRIGLFHGALNNSLLPNSTKIEDDRINNEQFNGLDIAMLGDIHQYQILQKYEITEFDLPTDKEILTEYISKGYYVENNKLKIKKPTIAYSSSLIQQNYGENMDYHGMIKWDIFNNTHKYINIKNDYGFCTLEIFENKLIEPTFEIPKYPKVKIVSNKSKLTDVKEIIAKLQDTYKFNDYNLIDFDNNSNIENSVIQIDKLEDLTDINYQNHLIVEYLTNKYINEPLTSDIINEIKQINEWLNNNLNVEKIQSKSNKIKIKEMWFSNFFNYGENNYVNFESLNGIIGLFNKNASGKSSFLYVLLFMLQDNTPRTKRALDLLNIDKDTFEGKIRISINNKDYFIEKKGIARLGINNRRVVKVDVDFYYLDSNNERVLLNGEQRRETINNIRTYLGEFKHLLMTSFSLQNNNEGIINETQTDRKQLLSSFLGLDIFSYLSKSALEEIKTEQTILKSFKDKNLNKELIEFEREKYNKEQELIIVKTKLDNYETESKQLNTVIKDLSSKVNTNLKDIDIVLLNKQLKTQETDLVNTTNLFEKTKTDLINITNSAKTINVKLSEFNVDELKKNKKQLDDTKLLVDSNKQKLNTLQYTLSTQKDKLKKLKDLEYDEHCNFCMNNVFVKDAINTKETYKSTEQLFVSQSTFVTNLETTVLESKSVLDNIKEFSNITKEKEKLKLNYEKTKSDIDKYKTKIELINSKITNINNEIELFYTQQKQLELNKQLNIDIKAKTTEYKTLLQNIKSYNEKVNKINSDVIHFDYVISDIERQLSEVKEHENTLFVYNKYIEAIDKDGLQYELIRQMVPKLKHEVNNILTEIQANFNLEFILDEKDIDINIVYKNRFKNESWSIDLTSGMERFISSIAVRVALSRISNLPTYNFLIVDEGFSNLDSENMIKMDSLFEYLKNFYDFIIIISHLDVMRDVADKFIQIDTSSDNYAMIQHY